MQYDILLVGAGITNATIAALNRDKKILILERDDIGGLCRTEEYNNIHVHKHGAHVFHTSIRHVWDFVNQYANFNGYVHRIKAMVGGEILSFPINLDIYNRLYQLDSPEYVKELISSSDADNFEDYLIESIGDDLYDKFYKGYAEKLWGLPAHLLPRFLAIQSSVRSTFNDIYYDDVYQGVPANGYTAMIEDMTSHCEILNIDFMSDKEYYESIADVVIYTGSVDEYFDYRFGELPYRSVVHYMDIEPVEDMFGIAQMNYCDESIPYIKKIEHKHLNPVNTKSTIITTEYVKQWVRGRGMTRAYPIPLEGNHSLYSQYVSLPHKAIFAGSIGNYVLMDMDECVMEGMHISDRIREQLEREKQG